MANGILAEIMQTGKNDASFKARNDLITFLIEQKFEHTILFLRKPKNRLKDFFRIPLAVHKTISNLTNSDLVIIQYPYKPFIFDYVINSLRRKSKDKGYKVVVLIHDINYLRETNLIGNSVHKTIKREITSFNKADYIISHNEAMTASLRKNGLTSKALSLEVFDYKHVGELAKNYYDGINYKIIIAGNLNKDKTGYVYKIPASKNIQLNLYGSNFDNTFINTNAKYYGSFNPDELISNLEGNFGLVWDGNSINGCDGNFGKYLKYNNPHKLSLYLAAGLPVIVWSESAVASFVLRNKIGICVESLDNMEKDLSFLSKTDYHKMVQNAERIGADVRNGNYLKRVITSIAEDMLV